MQGEDRKITEALRQGNRLAAPVDEAHQELLAFVENVTKHAYKTTAEMVQRLRDVGWSDAQIAEAVYVCGLFAMFNRVADAFGLIDPQYLEAMDEGEEGPKPAEKFE